MWRSLWTTSRMLAASRTSLCARALPFQARGGISASWPTHAVHCCVALRSSAVLDLQSEAVLERRHPSEGRSFNLRGRGERSASADGIRARYGGAGVGAGARGSRGNDVTARNEPGPVGALGRAGMLPKDGPPKRKNQRRRMIKRELQRQRNVRYAFSPRPGTRGPSPLPTLCPSWLLNRQRTCRVLAWVCVSRRGDGNGKLHLPTPGSTLRGATGFLLLS